MDEHTPLTTAEIDTLMLAGLVRLGFAPVRAARLVAARWPMAADDVLAECRGRGLALSPGDLVDFLRERYGTAEHPDGEALTADSVGWFGFLVDLLLCWAAERGRGTPTPIGEAPAAPRLLTVSDMLAALRSADLAERVAGGLALAQSIGVGLRLAGEMAEDVEHIRGPAVSALLGRAMAGEPEALAELESHLSTEPPAATAARNPEA